MIQLPRRSVTRFFIPMIDVLTLLFCIFLLMPMVKPPADEPPGRTGEAATDVGLAEQVRADREPGDRPAGEVEKEREELQRLQREKIQTLQERLAVRVLEIDADTGKLYYNEPEQRVEITSQADARALIERQRREAPGRELYYLLLFPRRVTGYPEQKQIRQYERWLEGVAHGIDNPRGRR
jgi:hypothetical protein